MHGEPAGEALLGFVGETLRANPRPYDVIVRYGGDKFLCPIALDTDYSIGLGLAQADPADDLNGLITRTNSAPLILRHACAKNG
jgi:GGDEF domain-containing protein